MYHGKSYSLTLKGIQSQNFKSVCPQTIIFTQPAIACSKLIIEALEQGVKYVQSQWRRSDAFLVNFEHISHLVLVFLLLTLSR